MEFSEDLVHYPANTVGCLADTNAQAPSESTSGLTQLQIVAISPVFVKDILLDILSVALN